MAKNEAKIKFTAETGDFNKAIKKAGDEMSELRSELKKNEAQMENTGSSVEALEKNHSLLEKQLKASQSKTEALTQKVAKAVEIFGENSSEVTKLKKQLNDAQAAEEKIKTAISKCNSEIEKQAKAAKEAKSATGQLTDKIEEQQSEVDRLKKEYVEAVLQYGKNSTEAKSLARELSSLSGELKDNKTEMSKAESAADKLDKSLDDVGDAARNTEDGFTVAKGAIADLASNAIQAAIGKVSEFIDYLMELPEATREIRQDMATLETSFERQGFSTKEATDTWKELYKVFGEDDRAVEAANLISKMSKNQEDLSDWVTITKGVWGTYQDSLPVEGLAEASNETAKTGKVTGVLADALNWSSEAASMFSKYMSDDVTTAEDAFNEALAECTTEQERQALITETLTALYGDAATEYEKASGSQIEAKDATAENILVQNELADTMEPLTTAWQEMKTEMISGFLPVAEKISSWGVSALGWMKEHPVAAKAIGAAFGVIAAALGALIIVVTAYTIAQWAMNSAVLANPITWVIVGIVAAIAAVVAIIVVVIEYWDKIVAAVKNCVASISQAWSNFCNWINTNVIQPVKNFFVGLWDSIATGVKNAWNWVCNICSSIASWVNTNVIQPVVKFFTNLWTSIKNIWDNIVNAVKVAIMFIGSIISAAVDIITLPFRFIWENCKEYVFAAWEWIKKTVSKAINVVKNTVVTVWNAVKNAFSTAWNACKNVVTNVWNSIVNFMTPIINKIKSVITTAWNAIKNVTTTVFNAVKSFATNIWNGVKNAVTTAVNAVKNVVTSIWESIKSATKTAFNAVKSVATSAWDGVKNAITKPVNAVKSKVTSVFNSVKSSVSNVFNGIKSTATNVWNGIKNAITKPIEAAKDKVKSIVDKIKGFFNNMKLSFPKIKLPHFSIKGEFSLSPPSVPKLAIDWYKEGGIMTKPTIFGMNGSRLMAGGEAGYEAILPIEKLRGYIADTVEKSMNVVNLDKLAAAVEDLANRPAVMNVNGRKFAELTAGDSDRVGGVRTSYQNRGLILD